MVAVSASQIDPAELHEAVPSLRLLSWRGLVLVGIRDAKDSTEFLSSLDLSLQGVNPSARPGLRFEQVRPQVIVRMKPLPELHSRLRTQGQAVINDAVSSAELSIDKIYYLPLTSEEIGDQWVVLLNL